MRATVRIDADRAVGDLRRRALAAVGEGGEFLLEKANRTVPIEEATLEGSGKVTVDRDRLVAAVSYDTPYALRQHEDTRLRHDPGRRAKWLEHTFREERSKVLGYLAERMRRGV
jgi:hypothetical protein